MHEDSVYRRTLLEAAWFAWSHPRLWVFGLFAGLLNAGGFLEVFFGADTIAEGRPTWSSLGNILLPGFGTFNVVPEMLRINQASPGTVFITGIFIALLILLVVYLGLVGQGALIAGAADQKETRFRTLTRFGRSKALQLVGINFAAKLLMLGLLLFALVPVMYFARQFAFGNVGLSLAAFSIFLPLALLVSLFAMICLCQASMKTESFAKTLRSAWNFFKLNWLIVCEMGLALFVLSLAAGSLFLFLVKLMLVPFTAYFVAGMLLGSEAAISVLIAVFWGLIIALIVLFFSFLVTFHYAAWTLLTLRLKQPGFWSGASLRYFVKPLRKCFGMD